MTRSKDARAHDPARWRGRILVVAALTAASILSVAGCPTQPNVASGWDMTPPEIERQSFSSNGERIYYTGTSARTGTIPARGGAPWMHMRGMPMHGWQGGQIGCVHCHGVHGRGGVPIMGVDVLPPDIRYRALVGDEGGAHEHGRYTEALLKRAITQGIDPSGAPLDPAMPRWRMGEQDVNDLIAYLKTL